MAGAARQYGRCRGGPGSAAKSLQVGFVRAEIPDTGTESAQPHDLTRSPRHEEHVQCLDAFADRRGTIPAEPALDLSQEALGLSIEARMNDSPHVFYLHLY